MNVTVENLAPCKKLVRVEVEAQRVDEMFETVTKEFQKEASKNDAAGQLAKETLPTLRKHLQAAQRLTAEKQSSR